jgi:hypothetical protein
VPVLIFYLCPSSVRVVATFLLLLTFILLKTGKFVAEIFSLIFPTLKQNQGGHRLER